MAIFRHAREPGRREYLAGRQGSHILSSLAAAEVLVELPEDCATVRPGDMVTVLPLFRS